MPGEGGGNCGKIVRGISIRVTHGKWEGTGEDGGGMGGMRNRQRVSRARASRGYG